MSRHEMFDQRKLPFTLEEYERAAEELRDALQAAGLQASIERQWNGRRQSEHPMVIIHVREKRIRGKRAFHENHDLMAKAERAAWDKASGKAAIAFKIIPSVSGHIRDAERKAYGAIHLQCRFDGLSPPDCMGSWANGYGPERRVGKGYEHFESIGR